MAFFKLKKTELFRAWGDYGNVLCNGLFTSSERKGLSRAGPFVPPISFPLASTEVVLTDAAKQVLENTTLSGLGSFRPVDLDKVVDIDWDKWDRTKKLKHADLPFNGEPEEYILHNPHDIAVASMIDQLWTWHPEQIGSVIPSKNGPRLVGVVGKLDVFRVNNEWWTKIIVNEKGKQVLSGIFLDWLSFEQIDTEIVH